MRMMTASTAAPAYFAVTHAVLLPSARQALAADARIARLITTDTLPPASPDAATAKIEVISVAPLLAEVIVRIFKRASIATNVDYQ